VVGGGEVTSGTMSPMLEVGIGLAYVPAVRATAGTEVTIDVRGKERRGEIRKKPLYRKEPS
jgi:aminomethyltransferase